MSGYDIGLSGIHAAQTGLDIVGNNIANATTEGFHRKEVTFTTRPESYSYGVLIGQGVDIRKIERMVNSFIDGQIVDYESTSEQISRELESLLTVETALGEMSNDALSTAMGEFFSSLHELSSDPTSNILQGAVITSAEALASQLRNLGSMVSDLEGFLYSEAQSTIETVNELTSQIATINADIRILSMKGHDATNVLDERDQVVLDLGRLVGITTVESENGMIDVRVAGYTVVSGTESHDLEVGLQANGDEQDVYLSMTSSSATTTEVTGGRLGGIFSLRNDLIRTVGNKIDTFAGAVINDINKVHVQGVGSSGSFTSLTGWTMPDEDLSDFDPPLVDGETIYVRVTNTSTQVVRRYEIAIDASVGGDTLTTISNDFDAITGIGSSVSNSKITITADANYEFDFLPGALADPMEDDIAPMPPQVNSTLSGNVPDIDILGKYTGTQNLIYTCTVSGTGNVGSGTLTIDVNDGTGTIATLNVGQGYTPGSELLIGDTGMKISFGPGELNNGEFFRISAVADSDASGFLAATGLNCFFSGNDANSIAVQSYVSDPTTGIGRIAYSRTVEMSDSDNAVLLAQIGDASLSSLGSMTLKDYYRDIVTDVAGEISIAETKQSNTDDILRSLNRQRDDISGVDMNDEAAKMLMFERLFQAMSKYMAVVNDALDTLMSISS